MAKDIVRKWNWELYENPSVGGKGPKEKIDIEMSDVELEKLSELLERATPLIEQVNSMYNQYRCGVDKRPPNERRATLDQVINSLQFMRKPTASARFRVRQVISKFLAYKDRWDRVMAMMETGKDPFLARRKATLERNKGKNRGT